jgi:hypothetical protein
VETGPRVMMGETLKNGPEHLTMWQTLSRRSNFQPHQLCHSGPLDTCPLSSHISCNAPSLSFTSSSLTHGLLLLHSMSQLQYNKSPTTARERITKGGWNSGNIGLGSVVCKIQWQCGTTDHRASLATRLTRAFRGLSNHATSHPSCLRRVFLWRR